MKLIRKTALVFVLLALLIPQFSSQVPASIREMCNHLNNPFAQGDFVMEGDTLYLMTEGEYCLTNNFLNPDHPGKSWDKNSYGIFNHRDEFLGIARFKQNSRSKFDDLFVYQIMMDTLAYSFNPAGACVMIEHVFDPIEPMNFYRVPRLKNIVYFDRAAYTYKSKKKLNITYDGFQDGKGKIRFKTGKTIRIDSYDNGQLHGVSEKFIQLKKKRRMLAMEHYYQGVKSGVQVKYDNGDLIRADLRSRKKEGGVDYYFHFKKNKLNKITIVQASNRRELGKKALPELKIKEESYNEIQIEVLNYLSKNASLLSI